MRGENFCESWKWPSGRKQKTETCEQKSLVAKFGFQLTHCATGQPPRLRSHSRDESAGFLQRQLFRCVVRLAKFVGERLDEIDAAAHQHRRRAFRNGERDHCRPSGVDAKADRGVFHVFLDFSVLCAMSGLEALDGEGYGVAAAEAEGGDAAFQVAALQFVEQRDEDSGA